MKTVSTLKEINTNIKVIDDYLKSKNENEVSYAKGLIKRGICFVIVATKEGYKFYPSRFIGYVNNSMEIHERNFNKDGKETNPAISAIIGSNPKFDENFEDEYKEYCVSLGFKPNQSGAFGVQRKYWLLNK